MKKERTKYWTRFTSNKNINNILSRKRGLVYIFTGDGEGKTTAALGLGLRALGHGKTVVVIQFMKARKFCGEYQMQDVLKNYEVYQFGKDEFVDLKKPDNEDRKLALEGIEFAKEKIKEIPDVLILDELNLVINMGLIDVNEVIKIIDELPKNMLLIITGRDADKKLIKIADVVSEIKNIKHVFDYGRF